MSNLVTVPQLNSNFNTGRDKRVTLQDAFGVSYALGKYTEIVSSPERSTLKVEPINNRGITLRQNIPDGWKGTITTVRENGVLEYLYGQVEADYYNGVAQRYFWIYETISNQDGSTDQFVYTRSIIWIADAGNWKKTSDVPIRLEFESEQRVPLTTGS